MKQRLARVGLVFLLLSSPVIASACDREGGEDVREVERDAPDPENEKNDD